MSSSTYSTRIVPEPRLRRLVSVSAVVLGFAGAALAATLPLPLPVVIVLAALAPLVTGLEMQRLRAGFRGAVLYVIHADGTIDIHSPSGRITTARVAAGSIILKRIAWLRMRTTDGRHSAELVAAGSGPQSQMWRRFQVICRHLAAC